MPRRVDALRDQAGHDGSVGSTPLGHALIRGEAVEQPIAAGAAQIGLATAAVWPARRMRRIPRLRWRFLVQSRAVVVADHGRPLGALRPVAAGPVLAGWKRAAVRRGAGKHIVPIGRVAAAVDHLAFLVERCLLGEIVVAVQFVDILGDDDALAVLPWAAPDAIARVDGLGAVYSLHAEVGAPGAIARTHRLRQRLAVPVCALDAAQVRPFAGADAGDEKGHGGLLRLRGRAQAQGHQHQGRQEGETHRVVHVSPPVEYSASCGKRYHCFTVEAALPVRPTPHWYGPRASARRLHACHRRARLVAPGELDLIIDVSQHYVTVNRGKMYR